MKKIAHIIVSIVFAFIVIATFALHEMGIMHSKPSKENRTLAEKPELNPKRLDYFPAKFEPYYNDHFSFRRQYIELMSKVGMKLFKKKNMNGKVIVGEDNWLFEMKKDLPIYVGKKTFSDEQLSKIGIELKNRLAYFDSLGIKTYFLICPSKYSIHPEKLPYFLQHRTMERTNLFIDELENNKDIVYVDGRESLLEKKDEHTVYQKFDTHWNRLGAFFAFSDLANKIRSDFPSLPNYQLNDFNIDTTSHTRGNLMWMIGKNKGYAEPEFKLTMPPDSISSIKGFEHIKTDDFPYSQWEYCRRYTTSIAQEQKIKTLIFHDSYAVIGRTFLPYYFDETLLIWDSWKYKFNKEIVDQEKPDIIIYWMYEGFIDRMLLEPSFVEPDNIDAELQ